MLEQALRETIRVQNRRIPLLERHLARLEAGGCEPTVLARARDEARSAASHWAAGYGRMTLLVEPTGVVSVDVTDRPSTIDVPGGPVVELVASDIPTLPKGAAKPADRGFWDRALATAVEAGADVAILVDDQDNVIDGSQASVWCVLDGELVTPPSPPALAGVSRAFVLDESPQLGVRASERAVTVAEFLAAGEAFLSTAVAGAVGIRGREGPVTEIIAAAFARAFGSD